MVSKMRLQRIADRLREDLSEMLIQDISDPRLSGISITDVKVDRELAFADIYVSAFEGSERSAEVLEGLSHAQGFIRRELAQRLDLRTFPRLRFHWDPTFERAEHIERLIASLQNEPGGAEASADAGADAGAEAGADAGAEAGADIGMAEDAEDLNDE